MILSDLPYGTTRNKWDSILPLTELWIEYERIIKDNGAIVLFSQMPFAAKLVSSNLKLFRYEWIFEKSIATGFLNVKKMPLKAHENILVFYKKLPVYNPQTEKGKPYKVTRGPKGSSNYGKVPPVYTETISKGERQPRSVIKFRSDRGYHPTQKPVALLEYLIKTYTNEGEVVLDNCIGSGSTAIAALNTGRKYIGYELDPEYFKVAADRVTKHFITNFFYHR